MASRLAEKHREILEMITAAHRNDCVVQVLTQDSKGVEMTKREIPNLPDISADCAFSWMHDVPGPDEIMSLSVAASEQVRKYLRDRGLDANILDCIRFEGLIMPFMFEARRIGDARGVARERSMFAGLFPGTE